MALKPDNLDSEKRGSQWEDMMRKFSEAHKEQCKSVSLDIPRVQRSAKTFPSGSQYDGTWDILGMSGYGTYTFPHGVVYTGEFNDGMFHGAGEMRYPSGVIIRGKWKKGVMIEKTLLFADGLEYCENKWTYCRMPDRRFTVEIKDGLKPAGKSILTADQPTRAIPPGYYDTGDGFYHPKSKVVYKTTDLTSILRSPSDAEQKWIVENCRYNPGGPVGARNDLYEKWQAPVAKSELPSLLEVSKNTSMPLGYANRTLSIMDDESDSEDLTGVARFIYLSDSTEEESSDDESDFLM